MYLVTYYYRHSGHDFLYRAGSTMDHLGSDLALMQELTGVGWSLYGVL